MARDAQHPYGDGSMPAPPCGCVGNSCDKGTPLAPAAPVKFSPIKLYLYLLASGNRPGSDGLIQAATLAENRLSGHSSRIERPPR